SQAAVRLGQALARVASTPRTTVLVRGPMGAPLDALARLVHARSARAAGVLVVLEAEGTPVERWAEVLGAADVPGTAEGGSVLVREVARLDAAGQTALAQRLEPRGEGGPRLIATTARELSVEVEAGRLREDLAYRLNVLSLVVPALSERREDVPELAAHLAARAARTLGRSPRALDAGTRAGLARRDWPGDLVELDLYMTSRELFGAASADAGGAPRPAPPGALPALGTPESLVVADRSLRAAEEALIRRVLEETGGNKLRAAEILGIHRTTLYAKLAAYGLGAGERV
ncbi:MAG TPA: helix-turn-helix domain-containing protein, partial [Planctomycetota bacterium]|nr:helix-turn-helix domain-containing protein [Planctomycetota bacterium]